jgi:hypothetical protein
MRSFKIYTAQLKNKMERGCGRYVREDKCIQSFGGETWKKKTTWKSHSGRMILKWMLSIIGRHVLDYRDEAGCCEYVNEYSCFIKCWRFLDQLLKKDNAVWREAVSEYSDQAMGWMDKELWCDSRREQEIFFPSPNCPTRPWGPPICLFNRHRCSSPGMRQLGHELHRSLPSSAEVTYP